MNSHWSKVVITLILSIGTAQLQAANLSIPNTFSSGDRALASEVNANFAAIEAAFKALADKVQSLEAQLADAESEIAALKNNSVLDLDGHVIFDNSGAHPTAIFRGVNVQIVNDLGKTDERNGAGNLIIGYNEEKADARGFCSEGNYGETECVDVYGGEWRRNVRTGSHNLVVGDGHSYTHHSGLLAGLNNAATGPYATVIGGYNLAGGYAATVTGGAHNTASGWGSSVSGGSGNFATDRETSVTGGLRNTASGASSSVTGGWNNTASGVEASVSGGMRNIASGWRSSVSGGQDNEASGATSSVSGGENKGSSNPRGWTAGTFPND